MFRWFLYIWRRVEQVCGDVRGTRRHLCASCRGRADLGEGADDAVRTGTALRVGCSLRRHR